MKKAFCTVLFAAGCVISVPHHTDKGGEEDNTTQQIADTGETSDTADTGSDTGEISDTGAVDETGETGDTGDTGADTGDTGEVTYYDYDGDGYSNKVDCNETDVSVNPGATEVCDDVDNNCDGEIDEGDVCDSTDNDGDGFSEADGDCNDEDPAVYPGALDEPGDGIDQNCDDEGDTDTGADTGTDTGDTGEPDPDADGDGYSASIDCDDSDAAVNPGATEVCDEIDNDCDGSVDESVTTTFYAYTDADGDGYGDDEIAPWSAEGCERPDGRNPEDGFAYVAGDCDDSDAEINPDAAEIEDAQDNDCDGSVDEGYDLDGDGYSESAGDCDDTDSSVNPGAAEVCNSEDDDCDGDVDEDVKSTYYADIDGDGYGDSTKSAKACSAPAGYVSDKTDCDDSDADINPGEDEAENGLDDDCDGEVGEYLFWEDTDGNGKTDTICMASDIFDDEDAQVSDVYVVGYDLFDWTLTSSDKVELDDDGFHCLSFIGQMAANNVEFTLIYVQDDGDWSWQVLTNVCPGTSDEIAEEVCENQSGYNYLLEVDWSGTELTASGDGA